MEESKAMDVSEADKGFPEEPIEVPDLGLELEIGSGNSETILSSGSGDPYGFIQEQVQRMLNEPFPLAILPPPDQLPTDIMQEAAMEEENNANLPIKELENQEKNLEKSMVEKDQPAKGDEVMIEEGDSSSVVRQVEEMMRLNKNVPEKNLEAHNIPEHQVN